MQIIDAVLLGVVQGVTEFLPISSSGHLILARDVLGITLENSLAFDAVLHLATACAILLYFRKDITRIFSEALSIKTFISTKKYVRFLPYVIAAIPVVIVGLLFESHIESIFRSSVSVAIMLIVGSMLFIVSEYVAKKRTAKTHVGNKEALLIGTLQILSLIPGMSRSGSTISAGLLAGVERASAAQFSFLMALPLLFGVGFKKLLDIQTMGGSNYFILAIGSLTAFVFGYIALSWLMKLLARKTLTFFALYRILLAIYILAFFQ